MSNPLVSIITPSYNQGEFIEETIKSILIQDYPNTEYIVTDGGSTDNTVQILKKYSDKIKWVSEKDNGQADAVNKGIQMANGEIIYWLNSDDVLLPGVITKIVELFEKNPSAQLIYGNSYFIDDQGNIIGNVHVEPFDYKTFAVIDYIPQPSTFFKKDVYLAVGGIDRNMHYAMDYDLWLKIANDVNVIYYQEYLSYYRLHDNSKTVDKKQTFDFSKETLDTVIKYYKWAPVGRVYVYCYFLIESVFSKKITTFKPFTIICALLLATVKYLQINKRIVKEDIQYIKFSNIKKIFVKWENMYKEY